MAITKIHPIKTTLDLSINYICNPSKTDGEILISSHACGHETASLEFEMTRKNWNSQSKNLARHLIQSFDPDDNLTSSTAHEIGLKLADKALKDKYEYILTTHIDKGHIHNHILFNNVSYIDGKAYNSNKRSYHQIRNQSDQLCRKYGISVIENPGKTKGKSYKEYKERGKGKSWKAQLQYAIDNSIKRSNSWEEFLEIMISLGYEIKEGKHIAFRAKDQERFTRSKTIGDYYTEEEIKKRIADRLSSRTRYKKVDRNSQTQSKVGRIINLKTNQKAKDFKGYQVWAKQHNLKNMARSLNLMTQYNIKSSQDLYDGIHDQNIRLTNLAEEVKSIESQIESLGLHIKNLENYKKFKPTFNKYKDSKNKKAFYKTHSKEIILFQSAKKFLDKNDINKNLENITQLKKELKGQEEEKYKKYQIYLKQKEKVSQLNFLKSNLETYMQWEEPEIKQFR